MHQESSLLHGTNLIIGIPDSDSCLRTSHNYPVRSSTGYVCEKPQTSQTQMKHKIQSDTDTIWIPCTFVVALGPAL